MTGHESEIDPDIDAADDLPEPASVPAFLAGRAAVPPADEIVAGMMIDEAMPADLLRRLADGEPLCVVIETPGEGWAEAIKAALRQRIDWNNLKFIVRETWERPTAGLDRDLATALAHGRPTIAISPMPDAMLPKILTASADLRVALPRAAAHHLRRAIKLVCGGRSPSIRLASEMLSAGEIRAAVRVGASASACVARLRRAAEAKSRTRSVAAPRLEQLGLGREVLTWATRLVADVEGLRRGLIGLEALPRGALLTGPPGTGKTLFAQSIATSAKLPIVATSVGTWMAPSHLGACIEAMSRDFARARAAVPSILFVDEIDALVDPEREDGNGKSWWMSFRSALLAATDGATSEPGIVFMGACNHVELVDRALRRPGRLDRVLVFDFPDPPRLETIIRTHLGRDLARADLAAVARLADGATGADVARAVRDARSLARADGRRLRTSDLVDALVPPDPRSPEVRRTIALHEAGHAVVAAALGAPLQSVTIVPRGTSGGSARLQLEDVVSRATIERRVVMLLAGRAADIAFSGEAFGNAGADLVLATRFLSEAHARMGLGATLFALDDPHPAMQYSDALRRSVEADLERLWSLTTALVEQERSAIMAVAEALLLRRILSADDVHRLRTAAHRGGAARPRSPPP